MPTTTPTAMATVFGLLSCWGAEVGEAVAEAASVDESAALDVFAGTELLLEDGWK